MRVIKRPAKRTPRKQLRAAAQRAVPKHAEEDYFSEEPNVKLSRAFVVVLLLHVVAVGGIFAFSSLKDRQNPAPANRSNSTIPKIAAGTSSNQESTGLRAGAKPTSTEVQKLIETSNPAVAVSPKPVSSAPVSNTERSASETNKTYVVQSGDSPAKIAKKFKVSSENLLKANKIEDPKKLKIGQILVIPGKG